MAPGPTTAMTQAPLRVGVVGLGRIADLHVAGYRDHPDARIVALCDVDGSALERRLAECPGAAGLTSFEDFLGVGLDLVEILTPHPLHAEMTVAALEAGAHVSVQKPMAMTLEACDRMIAAADRTGRRLRVFENALYYPPVVKARELIEGGAIGTPLHCRLRTVAGDPAHGWRVERDTWSWRRALWDAGKAGRLTFDDGHHKMAVALWLFGEVEEVYARIDRTPDATGAMIDAPASLTWVHRDPRVHVIWDVVHAPRLHVRSRYYALDECIEITGETGIVRIARMTGHPLDEPVLTLYRDGRLEAFHDLEDDWGQSFVLATRAFVDELRGRAGPARLSGAAGRTVLELALALESSAASQGPVRLPLARTSGP